MKATILFWLVIATSVPTWAQCDMLIDEVDEFTSTHKKATREVHWGQSDDSTRTIRLFTANLGGTRILSIVTPPNDDVSIDCVDQNSYSIFKFEDGTTMKLTHGGRVDCTSQSLSLALNSTMLETLRHSRVVRVRVQMVRSMTDYTISNPDAIAAQIACVD